MEIFDASQHALIKQRVIENGNGKDWWTGLNDKQQEGTYRWSYSNQIATYFSWFSGQPSGSSSDEVVLYANRNYDWADICCEDSGNKYALCQYLQGMTNSD